MKKQPNHEIVERHIQCPVCPSSDAYCVYGDGHGFCFSCNYFKPVEGGHLSDEFTYEYLPWRGVTKETMQFYDCKTKVSHDGTPFSIGFPYLNGQHFKIRKIADKEFYTVPTGATDAGLFGKERFAGGSAKCCTITEGELDAISLYQVLRTPCVSVHSASNAKRDCVADREYLASFERIYLAFDNDPAGRAAAGSVARLFDPNKVYLVKFTNRKDANEYLQQGEADELRNIWQNSLRWRPENVVSSLREFGEILRKDTDHGVPLPFPTLNSMMSGMRTSESVLITAQEGVGKTELMHAIQYQLLEKTDDNIGAIFIEEPPKRHLQSLAGIKLQAPVHLPGSGYTDDQLLSAVEEITRRDERLFVYSHFGSDDPDVLLDTIRYLVTSCNCRYILFDHITMAVTGLAGEQDERRALDYLTSRLEMMVVELDFCLIMVSHVNDFNQTRGSRNAAKVANTIIHATRNVEAGSNVVELMLKKNRFSGKTGFAGSYAFDPIKRCYTEVANDNQENTNVGLSSDQSVDTLSDYRKVS